LPEGVSHWLGRATRTPRKFGITWSDPGVVPYLSLAGQAGSDHVIPKQLGARSPAPARPISYTVGSSQPKEKT